MIATERSAAIHAAGIRPNIRVSRTVVALLRTLDEAIATATDRATVRARIFVVTVAVIAVFAGIYNAISTGRHLTIRAARVGTRVGIASTVVTFFTFLDDAITTVRKLTIVRAAITIDTVTVIAFFALLEVAISTA